MELTKELKESIDKKCDPLILKIKSINKNTNKKEWEDLRNQITIKYYSIIEKQAKNISSKNSYVSYDELTSYGFDGMNDAIEKYDPYFIINGRVASFKTYAIRRVFGSIIDNMRKYNDNVSLASRTKSKKINAINSSAIAERGFKLNDEEMARKFKISDNQFSKYKKGIYDDISFSISSSKSDDNGEKDSFIDLSASKNMTYTDSRKKPREKQQIYESLFDSSFSSIQKNVIYMKFYKGMTHKEISEELKLREQQVSVIVSTTIQSLKRKLEHIKDPEGIFFEE